MSTCRKRQGGLSLIELMVALLISSFLIIGVTQIYIDNKRSYAFQQNQSENQEGARFALLFLQQELGRAGYRRRPDQPLDDAFTADDTLNCGFGNGQTVRLIDQRTLCIRYQPRDANDKDCLGSGVPEIVAASYASPYTSAKSTFVEKISLRTDGQLVCANQGKKSEVLISGLADLRFEVGVGSAGSPQTVLQYSKKPDSTIPILSVRFTALMRSSGRNVRDVSETGISLAAWKEMTGATDEDLAALNSADQGQLYQVSHGTVMLRNLMP